MKLQAEILSGGGDAFETLEGAAEIFFDAFETDAGCAVESGARDASENFDVVAGDDFEGKPGEVVTNGVELSFKLLEFLARDALLEDDSADALEADAGGTVDAGVTCETGGPVEAGFAFEAGNAFEIRDPFEAGDPLETGDAFDTGDAFEIGDPFEAGDTFNAGDPFEAGNALEDGDAFDIGDAFETTSAGEDLEVNAWDVLEATALASWSSAGDLDVPVVQEGI